MPYENPAFNCFEKRTFTSSLSTGLKVLVSELLSAPAAHVIKLKTMTNLETASVPPEMKASNQSANTPNLSPRRNVESSREGHSPESGFPSVWIFFGPQQHTLWSSIHDSILTSRAAPKVPYCTPYFAAKTANFMEF
jgi:hypothetical protein